MDYKHRVLIYYHNPEYVSRYAALIQDARKDLELFACKTIKEVEKHIHRADIIFSGHTFPVQHLARASNLKWIQSMSAGVENYTRSKLLPPHVVLTKIKGFFGPIMSEYVIGYMLAITQKMETVFTNKRERRWKPFMVDSIRNKTLGVMGLGSVGTQIAYRLHLLGVDVIALDEQERSLPYVRQEYSVSEMEEFLAQADFVLVALPLTNDTEGILGEREFRMMKKSAYLINVSRGPLVQEGALVDALQKGQIAGAVLDVFNEEPLPANHPLWSLDNVIITPHISGPSIPEDMTRIFLENLEKFETGKQLKGVVDLKREY